MRDTRKSRKAMAIALAAGIAAVLSELFLRPKIERAIR